MSKTDGVFAVALALVVAGVALWSIPGALVVAGVLLAAMAWLLDEDDE